MDYIKLLEDYKLKNFKEVGEFLNKNQHKFKSEQDVLYFLANCFYESNNLINLEENLKYKTEARLKEVFKRAFIYKDYQAKDYLNNPEKLANLVYDSRIFPKLGLNNIYDDDGWKYRGRGAIQVTGRYNYQRIKDKTGIDTITTPDLLLTPNYALLGSMVWWIDNNCGNLKTLQETRARVTGSKDITINGFNTVKNIYLKLEELGKKQNG